MEMNERVCALEVKVEAMEKDISDIHRLTTAVELLAQQMQQMQQLQQKTQKSVDSVSSRLDNLEAEPARRYTSIKATVISSLITAVVGAVAGWLLAQIIH